MKIIKESYSMKHFIVCVVIGLCLGGTLIKAGAETGPPLDIHALKVLDLDTAAAIALSQNPSIHAAKARVGMARERLSQARSTIWPRLDLTGTYSRVDLSDREYAANSTINPFAENPEDYYQAELRLTWLLFNGFEHYYAQKSAEYGTRMSQAALGDVRRLLLSAVANGYYAAQLALENIRIAQADQAFYKKQLDDANSRLDAGAGSLTDTLNLEIRYNASRVSLIQAEKAYEASLYVLAALMGLEGGELPQALVLQNLDPERPEEMAVVDPLHNIEYAMAHRPDLTLNAYAVKIAQADVKRARAGFYPSLSLVGTYTGERSDDSSFDDEDFENTVALQVSYNLFAGGLTKAKVGEAKAGQQEALYEQKNLALTVGRNIRESVTRIASAQEQLTVQRLNTDLVQRNRDLVEEEYAAGQSSLVRLNEAQRDLTASQSRLAQALVSLRQNLITLDTDTGYILERFSRDAPGGSVPGVREDKR